MVNLEGLKIKCILKDIYGFMWFGTETGLYRYDGYNTELINTASANVHLSSNDVIDLYEDSKRNLWIGTDNGINKLNANRDSLKSFLIPKSASSPKKNIITAITEGYDGTIWCSSENGNLYRAADKEHFTFLTNVTSKTKGELLPFITDISEDINHNIWLADAHWGYQVLSAAGKVLQQFPNPPRQAWVVNYVEKNKFIFADYVSVYTYSHDKDRFIPIPGIRDLLDNKLHYIYQDRKGFIWVVTSEKLFRVNAETKQVDDFTEAFKKNDLPPFTIDCMFEDSNGRLWFGTYYGVFWLDNQESLFSTITLPEKTDDNTIFSVQNMIESQTGKILIGSYKGFFEYDTSTRKFQEYKFFKSGSDWSGWYNPVAKTFVADTNEIVWIASDGNGVLSYNTKSHVFALSPYINNQNNPEKISMFNFSLLKDTDGQFWVGGYNNLYLFDPVTFKMRVFSRGNGVHTFSSLKIRSLHEARDKAIWVGTDYGLYKIEKAGGVKGKADSVYEYNYQAGLSNNFINCIYEDINGLLWLGTKGGGINVLNPKNGKVEKIYTVKEGLSDNIVSAILPGKNELWISTDNGLSRLDLRQKKFRNFYIRDGLPDNTFNVNSALTASDGRLYFGSIDGIAAFYPDKILPAAEEPQVILTKLVQHNGEEDRTEERVLDIHTLKQIKLGYKDRFFTVYFALKNYFESANAYYQFAYRLEGISNDWQNIGGINYIQFSGLPAGNYTLRIKGMASNGIWGKELRISVTVGQAFYATSVAYAVYALIVLSVISIIFWFRISRIRLQNKLHVEHLEKEKLEELDQMKSRFFTNITHEFRTPLTLIITPLEKLNSLTKLPKPEVIKQQINVISRNARHLLRLINQLLDSAKLEAGSMRLTESVGDVVILVEQIIESFRMQAEKKNILLQYHSETSSIINTFDAEKLEQILNNLLSNALKFTPEGGSVSVKLSMQSISDNKNLLYLQVADTGIGIPATQLPFIFDRFYQVNDSRSRALAGSGLGLFLVKELAALLGGNVKAESKAGEGTIFTVTLPVRQANDLLPAETIAHPVTVPENEIALAVNPEQTEDVPLIMVVEDHDELRTFIAQGLTDKYRIITAANGAEGWRLVQQELPNLVITDVAMPEMDGFDLSRVIKNTPLTNHVAVILLTARASSENRLQGLTAGANDYLTKPFNLEELHLRITNLLNYQNKLRHYWQQRFMQPDTENLPAQTNEQVEDAFLLSVNQILDREISNADFTVEKLANEMSVSTRTLIRKLSSLTAMNAAEFMRSYRLKKAVILLKQGQSISEAAFNVGFETPSYFSKCFKAQFSLSPSEYILSYKQKIKNTESS